MDVLSSLDWIVIGAYFAVVFIVAFWSARKDATRHTAAGYFLAGRNVGWFVVGASLFASNIGAEHLVGLAGDGYKSGVAVAHYEVIASLVLLLLGWVFVPFYLSSGVYTMPEFLERRYSPAARWYLAFISIVGYVLTKISVTLLAGGLVIQALTGIDFWIGTFIVMVATGIYTVFGGLRAVLFTDLLQMFVLIGGAIAITVIGLDRVGGWGEMERLAGDAHLDMWKAMSDPAFPWTGVILGAPILGIWYWCTDQFIVQRVLSARNIEQARRGAIFAALLKLTPLFIMVIPGVIAFALTKTGQLTVDGSNNTLPALIGQLLPPGFRGLVLAGLLAALMSSLSSVFNSCSTLVTWDIYRKLNPQASERQLVWVGQIATAVIVLLGLAWIPMMQRVSGQLYQYLQAVQAYIAPPIAAVFLLGLFWKRLNHQGAIAALLTGFVLGVARLGLEISKVDTGVGFIQWYATEAFLHVAVLLFAICTLVLVAVSYLTPPPPEGKLAGLTFATTDVRMVSPEAAQRPWFARANVWFSGIVIAGVAAVWIYFRA